MQVTYLVHDDVFPSKLLQMRFLTQDHLVARDADVKVLVDKAVVDELMSFVLGSLEHKHINLGCPSLKLALPVVQG